MTDKEKDPGQEAGWPNDESVQGPGEPEGAEIVVEEEDELARVKTRLAYLAAEFDNYRKRVAREKEAIVSFGNERILLAVLPVLDNMERALSQAGASGSADALLSGVRMIYDQAIAEFRKFGLEQVEAVGRPFDPNLHEAIAKVPWEGQPENTVLAESRKGYLLNGRLLRPAQVTVAQGTPEAGPTVREGGNGPGSAVQGEGDGEA